MSDGALPFPARSTRAPVAALALAACIAVGASCTGVEGDFGGVPYRPDASLFAVADRHDLVAYRGTTVATLRPEADQTLTLVFTAALLDADAEWRRLPSRELLELKKDLATYDGLVLDGIPLAEVVAGAEWDVPLDGPGASVDEPFFIGVVADSRVWQYASDGLGDEVRVRLRIENAEPRAGGFVRGNVLVQRERGDAQTGQVAGGRVELAFEMPVVAERRGKANLAHLLPVMRCAAELGPVRAGGCRESEALPIAD